MASSRQHTTYLAIRVLHGWWQGENETLRWRRTGKSTNLTRLTKHGPRTLSQMGLKTREEAGSTIYCKRPRNIQVDPELVGSQKTGGEIVRRASGPGKVALYPEALSYRAEVSVPQPYAKTVRNCCNIRSGTAAIIRVLRVRRITRGHAA